MKINTSVLKDAIKNMKGIIPPKTVMETPGLLYDKGLLHANSTILSMTTRVSEEDDSTFIVPLAALNLIERLPNEQIEVIADKGFVKIKSSVGNYKFATPGVECFPAVPFVDESNFDSSDLAIEIKGDDIHAAINSVVYVADERSNKPIAQGVMFESNGEELDIVSCDGFRLAWNKIPYNGSLSVIIPKVCLMKVLSLDISETGVKLYKLGSNRAVFHTEQYIIQTRLIDASPLNYLKFFPPADNGVTVRVNRKQLFDCLQRLAVANENKGVKLNLSVSGKEMLITSKSTTTEFSESIDVLEHLNGTEKIEALFNTMYLTEAVKASSGETVIMQVSGRYDPMIITSGNLKQLSLPMRV